MEVLKSFTIETNKDVDGISDFLRTICDTESGVPLSLDFAGSYKSFRIKCLQACNEEKPDEFKAFVGKDIVLHFRNKNVLVYRTYVTLPNPKSSEQWQEDLNDDI